MADSSKPPDKPTTSVRSTGARKKIPQPKTPKAPNKKMYDSKGIHIESGKDICDCLIPDCPGCHFNCPKCKSTKCGPICRCNRGYCYKNVEFEGTLASYNFSNSVE